MLDMCYQSGQNAPDWFDVVRPTKLPSFEDAFGGDGHTFADVRQSRLGTPSAFRSGHNALVNLLNHSVDNLMWGGELQWGKRENNSDGFTSDDLRIQYSFEYNFGYSWGG